MGSNYRYGFNGKENDNEASGDGNKLDFGARIYNSRLGRWLSVDPIAREFPSESPYIFGGNSPVVMMDPNGKFKVPIHKSITLFAINNPALKHLSWQARQGILSGNTAIADYLGANTDWHFDGRENFQQISAVWKGLNDEINRTSKDFGLGNRIFGGHDAQKLGAMLHTVQDFYAHSNYIELYIKYYQDSHNGELPVLSNVPTFDEAVTDANFKNNYLIPNLKTGEFNLVDYILGATIDKIKGKENRDITKTHKRGGTHHNDLAKDNKEMGKSIKSKSRTINTHDAAVEVAKKHSKKVVEKVVGANEK